MASDSDMEINVEDVCDSIAVAVGEGVEVQTIMQGQAGPGDLDIIVQEEVETTTEGITVINVADLGDPVDNVIIALQNTDQDVIHYGDVEEEEEKVYGQENEETRTATTYSGRKRPGRKGSSIPRKRSRKGRKGVRFVNRRIPSAITASQNARDAREANEASFDVGKKARRWASVPVPMRTLDGGEFKVRLWKSGMCVGCVVGEGCDCGGGMVLNLCKNLVLFS